MPRGPLPLSFFSPKFCTVLDYLYCLRPRDSPCPRSSLVHVFNKHSLGTYYKLTTLGTRARGVKKTDLILALQGYNLEGDTDYHSSKYITMPCGLTEEIVGSGKHRAGEANAHLGEIMEDFLEEAIPKLTLEEGVGITQSGGRRVFKAEEIIPAKGQATPGPLEQSD